MPDHRSQLEDLCSQVERLSDQPSSLLGLGFVLAMDADAAGKQDCSLFQDDLPDYVESELCGQPVQRLYPDLARHLDLCADCAEIYLDLLELALEAEEAPLLLPSEVPDLDLSFLPSVTLAGQVRELVESIATELLRLLKPQSLPNLPAAGQVFFQKIGESRVDYSVGRGPALALGFGPDLPPALQSLAAVYIATLDLMYRLSADELEGALCSTPPSTLIHRRARTAAQNVGMKRSEASRWADLYAVQARAHAGDLARLARQLAKDERPE